MVPNLSYTAHLINFTYSPYSGRHTGVDTYTIDSFTKDKACSVRQNSGQAECGGVTATSWFGGESCSRLRYVILPVSDSRGGRASKYNTTDSFVGGQNGCC